MLFRNLKRFFSSKTSTGSNDRRNSFLEYLEKN